MQKIKQSPIQKFGETHKLSSSSSSSPNLSLSASNSCRSDLELSINGQQLIPGLPDDIALNCLLRITVKSHTVCRAVCKRWNLLLTTKQRFFKERRDLGFHDPWLYVHAFCKRTERLQWQVLDLTKLSWHTIKPMPDCVNNAGFRCVSIPHEGTLFVCGNMDSVLKYEAQNDQWSIITNKMITPRCHFAAEFANGMLCVAGGYNGQLSELNSAESMDPIKGVWRSIPSMGMSLASYDSAVLDGKFLVTEGWLWPFFVSPRGQVYDPENESWETMAVGLREGWTGSSVVVYDRLFVVTEHERMKLKVYDRDSDSWETIDGPPLPDQICKPFCVSSCDSRIFVVGRGLRVAVGYVCRVHQQGCSDRKKWRFSVSWSVVQAPDELSELTPSSSQVLFG